MHKSHVLFPGWYVEQCFTILHFICGSTMFPWLSWFSLFVQMNFDRVVELVLASSLKECICACMRVFTSLQVRPMYSAFWISARYMTALVLQPPSGRGQFFRQLQGGTGVGVCSFWSTFLLWLLIINFIEGQMLKLILTFFLFMTGCRGWVMGKCLSMSWRNNLPNLVVRDEE